MDDLAKAPTEPDGKGWVQHALASELIAIVNGSKWLDICRVLRVARALDTMRAAYGMKIIDLVKVREYPGLIALHCVNYAEMSDIALAGIPRAVLLTLGLNRKTGPMLLGMRAWRQVEFHYSHPVRTLSIQTSPALAATKADTQAAAPAAAAANPDSTKLHMPTPEPAELRNAAANDPTPTTWKYLRRKATELANNQLKNVVSQLKRYMTAPRLKRRAAPRTAGSHPPWNGMTGHDMREVGVYVPQRATRVPEQTQLLMEFWEHLEDESDTEG